MTECPLCLRDCPETVMEKHHLKTVREDREDTEKICRQCHKTIHGLFPNIDLRDPRKNLDSVDGLMSNERFYKAVRFLRKKDPTEFVKMRESERKRKWKTGK